MKYRCLLFLSLLTFCASLGCGSVDPRDLLAEANSTNIQRLSNLYEAFQSRNGWNGPKDEEEFKSFLKGWNPKKLKNLGVDQAMVDDLFIGGRDGQPFKIRYGVRGELMGSSEPVIFEAEGVDGKRMVGFLNMTTREVDAAEYDQLWEGNDPVEQTARK